ncbi:MAG: Rieske 2Fe-2S domain-containing protein [Gammaproteobacteria bacterium]|nr:Rieske 2Fe-2S domain-containing protein [Gammaproteobacteria bacterium]
MAKILGIGNAVMDQVVVMEDYPKENSESRCLSMSDQLGGNAVNSLTVLAQMGHQTDWMGTYTKDMMGQQLLTLMAQQGINAEPAQYIRQGKTPVSSIWIAQASASRTINHFRDLPELSFEHFARTEFESYDWLHFEARNTEALMGMMNLAKCFLTHQPISLEVEKDRPLLAQLMPQVNILFFSQTYAQHLGFAEAAPFLYQMHRQAPNAQLFCGWGSLGAYAMSAGGDLFFEAATSHLNIVDTLGAGDTFNAGIIDALVRGHNTQEALTLATRLAEKKIQQKGLTKLFSNDHRIRLGNLNSLNAYKGNVIQPESLKHSVIVLKYKDTAKAYVNNCPHANVPLDSMYKVEIDPRALTLKCSVHDAYFNVADGLCVAGPCHNQSLKAVPISIDDQGNIFLT